MAINSEHRALPGDATECFRQAGTSRFDPQPDPFARCSVTPNVTDLRRTFSQKRVAAQKMQPQYGTAGSADSAVLWLHLCGCEEVQRKGTHKFRASGRHAVIGIVTLAATCTCNKPVEQ